MSVEVVTAIAIKFLAGVGGAILALAFQPPKALSEFVTRSIFSILSGMLFAGQAREYLQWPITIETEIASGSLTALLSWWVMGAVVRLIDAWKGPTK